VIEALHTADDVFRHLEPLLNRYGLWLVVAMLFVEHLAFIGFLAEANTTLLLVGFSWHQPLWMWIILVIVSALSATTAASLSRLLGTRGGGRVRARIERMRRFEAVAAALRRRALLLALSYHFVSWLRPTLPIVSGTVRVRHRWWYRADYAGALSWVTVMLLIGHMARRGLNGSAVELAAGLLSSLVLLVLVAVIALTVRQFLREGEPA